MKRNTGPNGIRQCCCQLCFFFFGFWLPNKLNFFVYIFHTKLMSFHFIKLLSFNDSFCGHFAEWFLCSRFEVFGIRMNEMTNEQHQCLSIMKDTWRLALQTISGFCLNFMFHLVNVTFSYFLTTKQFTIQYKDKRHFDLFINWWQMATIVWNDEEMQATSR